MTGTLCSADAFHPGGDDKEFENISWHPVVRAAPPLRCVDPMFAGPFWDLRPQSLRWVDDNWLVLFTTMPIGKSFCELGTKEEYLNRVINPQ